MYSKRKIEDFFSDVDWDFEDAWTSYGLNNIHWYPTKLPPQIASKLIIGLSNVGDKICDPFCGSGVVLSEATRHKRFSLGADINPIACMISRAKTQLISLDHLIKKLDTFLEMIWFGCGRLDNTLLPMPISIAQEKAMEIADTFSKPEENIEFSKWFHPITYRDLCFVSECIKHEPEENIRLLLTVLVSSILRTCSSQNKSWGYIADNVYPKFYIRKNIFKLLKKRFREVKLSMQMAVEQCASIKTSVSEANQLARVIRADSRRLDSINSNSIDCIITSPPYPNVSDNVTSQRLSMMWLGYDVDMIKQIEIGARWKRFRKKSLDNYLSEMRQCLYEMERILKRGGRLAIILGVSEKREDSHPLLSKITNEITESLKMYELSVYKRKIKSIRQHGSHGVMTENIYIFRKS